LPIRVVAVVVVALGWTPLAVSPAQAAGIDSQQAYVKASNSGDHDGFGSSVAVSGDTMVVGSATEDSGATGVNGDQSDTSAASSGAAYVFVRSGGVWSQQAYLKASNTGGGDQFGIAVAISGDTIVVGANSEDSNATGVDGDQSDNSAVQSGAAYVFTRSGSTWSQQAYLKASNTGAGDAFAGEVAIAGDTIVVGAPAEASNTSGVDGNQADNSATLSGASYVFARSGTSWSQQGYLKASNAATNDVFGSSVAISGDTIVVGAYREASNATGVDGDQSDNSAVQSGAAYVFTRSGSTWSQQAYLKASNTGANNLFGQSVALSGDTIVVGAYVESSNATGIDGDQANNLAAESGAAYVFTRSGSTWSQQAYLKASNTDSNDFFGQSVAISGDRVVVGAYRESSNATGVGGDQSDNSAANSGAAYVFTRSGSTWTQQNYLKASNTDAGDQFARSVAISGATVVASAIFEASNATGIDGDQSDNSATVSGAVYVFAAAPAAPAAPFGIQAFPGNGQVNVSWLPPGDEGSSPVTGYTVTTYTQPGGALVVGKTCSPASLVPDGGGYLSCTVTGLTNGTIYSFTVHATNSVGDSAESAASLPVNPTNSDHTKPTVTINQASGQKDPANAIPIKFTVKFSEDVTGFAAGDVTLSGTAKPSKAKVTGSAKTYLVQVWGMPTSGSVVAKVRVNAATDAASNTSTASTSTDNKVTFHKPIAGLGAKTLNQILNQKTVERGHKITATVTGLAPREWFYFYFDATKFKTGQADTNGKVTAQYAVPLSTPLGKHTIRVNGQSTNRTNIDSFVVERG